VEVERAPSVVSHEEFMLVVKDVDFDEDTILACAPPR
jgi:hypothetical protein